MAMTTHSQPDPVPVAVSVVIPLFDEAGMWLSLVSCATRADRRDRLNVNVRSA